MSWRVGRFVSGFVGGLVGRRRRRGTGRKLAYSFSETREERGPQACHWIPSMSCGEPRINTLVGNTVAISFLDICRNRLVYSNDLIVVRRGNSTIEM